MPAPLPKAGGTPHAWQELEDVFSSLGQLARSPVPPTEFYRQLLAESVRALSATGGAVWLRESDGSFHQAVQLNWPREAFTGDKQSRKGHESLLTSVAREHGVRFLEPHASTDDDAMLGNPTDDVMFLTPVRLALAEGDATKQSAQADTRAIVEILLRRDLNPAAYRGCEQFLAAASELAADYHAYHELRQLHGSDTERNALLRLARDAGRTLDLHETAYAVANEGRSAIGCDRLNVLVVRGNRCRLLATSGVSRIERRSGAARRLEQVATLVRRTDEAALYTDGVCDALPPIADALEQHAEESHARQIAAVPLHRYVSVREQDETVGQKAKAKRSQRAEFVLVAEHFDGRGFEPTRLVEVSEACSSALYSAWEFDRLPFGWLLRPLGTAKQQLTAHLPRTVFLLAGIAATITALVLVPADFTVEAAGTLEPVVQRDVFAPRSGLVEEVLVSHGATVKQGEPLVRMRDPELELEIKRVDGNLETAGRQLDAVRATRTNRAIRETKPTDAYRLSAEERELQQQLTNLRHELELLEAERNSLLVTAPIAGRVLTWDISQRLAARPIERGQVLMSVADLSQDWQLELDVPDDRIGYVLAAQQKLEPALPVRFRLNSDDREQHEGHVAEICQTASVEESPGTSATPSVLVKVALDRLELSDTARKELRPGVTARAQIDCGKAPLGYVWLHDIWDTLIEWATF